MESDRTLLAKITRPRNLPIHPRADLLTLLDELRTAPLTIISGFPGAGKAALVVNYMETRNLPCLWYQLDNSDENFASFFHYLGLAARGMSPSSKSHIPDPTEACCNGDNNAIRDYFSQLYRCFPTPFTLVFNDYHVVMSSAVVREVVQGACSQLPNGGRALIICSNDCPPTVSCLRANHTTAVVGWQELQLYPARVKEIAALHGLSLPAPDALRQLQRRVGNWAAELIFALQRSSQG